MDIELFVKLRINAEFHGMRTNVGFRRARTLLHDVAQAAGQLQRAVPGMVVVSI